MSTQNQIYTELREKPQLLELFKWLHDLTDEERHRIVSALLEIYGDSER